jgi:hypothetical protein
MDDDVAGTPVVARREEYVLPLRRRRRRRCRRCRAQRFATRVQRGLLVADRLIVRSAGRRLPSSELPLLVRSVVIVCV